MRHAIARTLAAKSEFLSVAFGNAMTMYTKSLREKGSAIAQPRF